MGREQRQEKRRVTVLVKGRETGWEGELEKD
jgi:hypothetical protein